MTEFFYWFDGVAPTLAGWVLTFAIHSTVLLGLVWLVSRWWADRASWSYEPLEERLWRVALLGSLLTTSLVTWGGVADWSGLRFDLAGTAPAVPALDLPSVAGDESAPAPSIEVATDLFPGWLAMVSVLMVGCLLYLAIAGGFFVQLLRQFWLGRQALADRREVLEPEILSTLTELRVRAGLRRPVRVSCSDRVGSPIAFGLFAPEICVPPAGLESMADRHRGCVLGHELAHVRHRDAWWRLLLAVMGCVFFFQPLLAVARRRLRDLAEYRCDAWVVHHLEDRIGMANALVEVAGWLSGGARRQPLASTMAQGDSPLRERVDRILDRDGQPGARSRWLVAPALLLLAAASAAMPSVTATGFMGERTPIKKQLAVLEGEIADLHAHLATAWRKLAGRDDPGYTATLQMFEKQLQLFTQQHRALCEEAARAASTTAPTNSGSERTEQSNRKPTSER